MTDALYTQPKLLQFRGPSDSGDYNQRLENNYKDLVIIKNQANLLMERVRQSYSRMVKDQDGLIRALEDIEDRVSVLEASINKLTFHSDDQVDCNRFANTPYAIDLTSRCYVDVEHGYVTLPKVDVSSISRLTTVTPDGETIVPSNLEFRVVSVENSADDGSNMVDTSDPLLCATDKPSDVWERNVITASPHENGAAMDVFVRLPAELFVTNSANCIVLHPFPAFSTLLDSVSYTTKSDVVMDDSDGYTPLNNDTLYSGVTDAVGFVPPGAWSGDLIQNCAPKAFYFEPKSITGLKLRIRQPRYLTEGGKAIYTYGMRQVDVRYNKYLSTGKTIIRFTATANNTITTINSVQPKIYNVSPAILSDVFSYRIIWETSYNSGIYTVTPVANSRRIWIEVTLNQTPNGGTPALSGLVVDYS